MTKERFDEIRSAINERIDYYTRLSFTNLAEEFTKFRNFLNEIENAVNENIALTERVAQLEKQAADKIRDAAFARDQEGY